MTEAEIQAKFKAFIVESGTNQSFSDTIMDSLLLTALRQLCAKYLTYTKETVVPVAEGVAWLAQSSILPAYSHSDETICGAPMEIQWQRGESGTAAITDDSDDALFTDAAHGLSDDDVVYLVSASHADNRYKVNSATTNTFKLNDYATDTDTLAYVTSENAVWIKSNSYSRVPLESNRYEDVWERFINPIEPNANECPQGTLFIRWPLTPGEIPATDLDNETFPRGMQEFIALHAVLMALSGDGDVRELGTNLQRLYREYERMMEDWKEVNNPHKRVLVGPYHDLRGVYGYRQQDDRSLIIYPGLC